MVGEFPELQGLMGGYYARAEGLSDAAADAIRDHYKPVGQGDDVPTAPVTAAVALADKLDTSCWLFRHWQSSRPDRVIHLLFRRAAIGVIRIVAEPEFAYRFASCFRRIAGEYQSLRKSTQVFERHGRVSERNEKTLRSLEQSDSSELPIRLLTGSRSSWAMCSLKSLFLADRLEVQQREAGVRHDLIDAVFALGARTISSACSPASMLCRPSSPPKTAQTSSPAPSALRRSSRRKSTRPLRPTTPASPPEAALIAALDVAEPQAEAAVAAEALHRRHGRARQLACAHRRLLRGRDRQRCRPGQAGGSARACLTGSVLQCTKLRTFRGSKGKSLGESG